MSFPTKPSNQDFIILQFRQPSLGTKAVVFFPFLMNSDTLPDGRIRLLSFNTNFSQDNSFGMGSSPKRMCLLVLFVMPFLVSAMTAQLPGCPKPTALAHHLPPAASAAAGSPEADIALFSNWSARRPLFPSYHYLYCIFKYLPSERL
uniref:Uncharacterized protein n=1 Tax=Podarcis muralis TaxID=64176 RepID=A0A670JQ26_PODMU